MQVVVGHSQRPFGVGDAAVAQGRRRGTRGVDLRVQGLGELRHGRRRGRTVGSQAVQQGIESRAAVVEHLALQQVDRQDLVRALVDHRDAAVPHGLLDAVLMQLAAVLREAVEPIRQASAT